MKPVGIIGLGKVGKNLAYNFLLRNAEVYIASHRPIDESFPPIFKKAYLKDVKEVVKNSSIIFLSVKDSQIENTFFGILPYLDNTKLVFILSGAFEIEKLRSSFDRVVRAHPVKAFVDNDISNISGTLFVCENESYRSEVEEIFQFLECRTIFLKNFSFKYHTSLAIASNFLVTLFNIAKDLLNETQIENGDEIVYSLMKNTLENIKSVGSINALTGPIERNDIETIKKHISSIDDKTLRNLYILMSLKTIEVAKKKNPSNNYSELIEFLRSELWRE